MKKALLAGAVLMSMLALRPARALEFVRRENVGALRTYSARTSVVSTHTVSGIVLNWSVYAAGGTADFSVKHSTDAGTTDPMINTSSTIYALQGIPINEDVQAIMYNPILNINRIDTPGTTVYITIDYIVPRNTGEF